MLAGADKAFRQLATSPALGPPVEIEQLRKWRVPGFPKLLIFYRVEGDILAVIRVLHAARDLPALLDA